MAEIKIKIAEEFEHKRRLAERKASQKKREIYQKLPQLIEIDREISDTATMFTKRLMNGEDVEQQMRDALALLFDKKKKYLNNNGYDILDFEPVYECKKCNDSGYVNGERCSCFKNRLIEENFRHSNIGALLTNQSFDRFDPNFYSDELIKGYPLSPRENMRRSFKICKKFADDFDAVKKSLLLIGGTGLGKTFLSTCIARQLLSSGKSVIYISAVDFFKRIEKARFDSGNTDVSMFENCDLLIIDDLGTEAPSVYTVAVFTDILDSRYRSGKKMIISSNNKFKDFENIYGERVFSRLAGCFECLLFYGKDIRIQKFINNSEDI